jgi:cytochrome c oxidase subunit III
MTAPARTSDLHAEQAAPAAHQSAMPTVLLGMLLFIASEVMFFGGLFAAYFNARASVAPGAWHPPEPGHLDLPLAAALTVVLVTSSVTMQFAVWAIRRNNLAKLKLWVGVTLALGVLFLLGQLYDYTQLGFGIADGIYGTTFYTLTGFHGAHVAIGVAALIFTSVKAFRGAYTPAKVGGVEIMGLYWHFVDLVWIVLFTIVYLV